MPASVAELASAILAMLEGTHLIAYQDSGGVWTIGTGDTGLDVHPGMTITMEEASARLQVKIAPLLKMVDGRPILEAAALVSFGYNCGIGSLAKVLSGSDSISNPKYTRDLKGHVLPGLVARRHLEQTLIAASTP